MTIVTVTCISDTHGRHRALDEHFDLYPGDILIHSGDFCGSGTSKEAMAFNDWLGEVPFKHKIVVAGNHDRIAYLTPRDDFKNRLSNAIYLQDEMVEVEGLLIYGTPWTPMFCNWYFMLSRGPELAAKYELIPEGADIVVTHGPPAGKLDWSPFEKMSVGSEELRKRLDIVKPKLSVFGHIHNSYGEVYNDTTVFANASSCNEQYLMTNRPLVYTFLGKEIV